MRIFLILAISSLFFSPLLQATCCLTNARLSIRPYADQPHMPYIDDTAGWAHAFDLDYEMEWRDEVVGGQCVLEWWEEADYIVPGLRVTGIEPNRWYDHKIHNTLSPMWQDWNNKQARLSSAEPKLKARISDFPGLGLSGVNLVTNDEGELIRTRTSATRRLRINAVVKSGSTDCPVPQSIFSVTQFLKVLDGQPVSGYLLVHQNPHLIE